MNEDNFTSMDTTLYYFKITTAFSDLIQDRTSYLSSAEFCLFICPMNGIIFKENFQLTLMNDELINQMSE